MAVGLITCEASFLPKPLARVSQACSRGPEPVTNAALAFRGGARGTALSSFNAKAVYDVSKRPRRPIRTAFGPAGGGHRAALSCVAPTRCFVAVRPRRISTDGSSVARRTAAAASRGLGALRGAWTGIARGQGLELTADSSFLQGLASWIASDLRVAAHRARCGIGGLLVRCVAQVVRSAAGVALRSLGRCTFIDIRTAAVSRVDQVFNSETPAGSSWTVVVVRVAWQSSPVRVFRVVYNLVASCRVLCRR